ncbi:MAG: hypothetical protein PHP00_04820 [Thiotrichaceae bacterium]|nr:hypothetical protein [Thiotrichaceae bacterium]
MGQVLKNIFYGVLLLLAAVLGGGKAFVDYTLSDSLQQAVKSVSKQISLRYSTAYLSWMGAVVVENVQGSTPFGLNFSVAEVRLPAAYHWLSLPAALPSNFSLELNDVRIPIPEAAAQDSWQAVFKAVGYGNYYLSSKELRNLGYAQWQGDIAFSGLQQAEVLKVATVIKSSAWGNWSGVLELNKVPALPKWGQLSGQMQVAETRLAYQDTGLSARLLSFLAQRQGQPVESLKTALAQKITQDIQQSGLVIDGSVSNSLKQFIQTPANLNALLQPTPPITINELLNAPIEKLPVRLGLKMTTAQP